MTTFIKQPLDLSVRVNHNTSPSMRIEQVHISVTSYAVRSAITATAELLVSQKQALIYSLHVKKTQLI